MFKEKTVSRDSNARIGELKTAHGLIETPFFMPVASKGAAKFLTPKDLLETRTNAIICNAFLLYLKPGLKTIKQFGGLHEFINWNKVIFTDSGGFQVLDKEFVIRRSDEGVLFRSPFDGSQHFFSPEKAIEIENALNSDVAMCLDDVPRYDKTKKAVALATNRTTAWAKRCLKAHANKKQLLFGISQGGTFEDLRKKSIKELNELDFDGMALGGLCIGEPLSKMNKIVKLSCELIPKEKPIYLMGVGSPREMLEAISFGVDIFDSCFPTRMARHKIVFTSNGIVNLEKKSNLNSKKPLDKNCDCEVCQNYSRAFLHHLMKTNEPNAKHFVSFHNVFFVQNLLKEAKQAIKDNRFEKFKKGFEKKYKNKN